MQIFLITVITLTLTFLLNPIFRKINKKRSPKLHVHHSVLGVLLLAIGIIAGNKAFAAVGLGIYLGHGIEEIYFNKTNLIKAFFIFVTR
jgi:predicted PurR-regulated permease PerM